MAVESIALLGHPRLLLDSLVDVADLLESFLKQFHGVFGALFDAVGWWPLIVDHHGLHDGARMQLVR